MPLMFLFIAEQFSHLRQWSQNEIKDLNNDNNNAEIDINKYKSLKAVDLLCLNSALKYVPRNIFQIVSNR